MNIEVIYPKRGLIWLVSISTLVYALFAYVMPDGIYMVSAVIFLLFLLMIYIERSPGTNALVVALFWIPMIIIQIINPEVIGIEYREKAVGVIIVACIALVHISVQGVLRHVANHIKWLNRE